MSTFGISVILCNFALPYRLGLFRLSKGDSRIKLRNLKPSQKGGVAYAVYNRMASGLSRFNP